MFTCLILIAAWLVGCASPYTPSPQLPAIPEELKHLSYRALWFDAKDPNQVFASRRDGIYRSTDKGKLWTKLGANDTDAMMGVCISKDLFSVIGVPNILSLEVLSDLEFLIAAEKYGLIKINIENCKPLPVTQASSLLVLTTTRSEDGRTYAGTSSGKILKIFSSGAIEGPIEVFPGGSIASVTVGPGGAIYAFSTTADIKVQTSKSITWTQVSFGLEFNRASVLRYNAGTEKWFMGTGNYVYGRAKATNRWEILKSFSESVSNIVVNPQSRAIMYVVTPNEIWRSIDAGSNWEKVLSAPMPPTQTPEVITSTSIPRPINTPTSTPTATPRPAETLTSTDTPKITATPMPTASASPVSPTVTPSRSSSVTPTATAQSVAGRYCVFADKWPPYKKGEPVLLRIVMSGEEPQRKPAEIPLDCGAIQIYPQMRLRTIPTADNEAKSENLISTIDTEGRTKVEWAVVITLKSAPSKNQLIIQASHSDSGSWDDVVVPHFEIAPPTVIEIIEQRPTLVMAITTLICALIGLVATLATRYVRGKRSS